MELYDLPDNDHTEINIIFAYNHCNPNNVDISGAHFTLRIKYEYSQPQLEEGARDVNNIWAILVSLVLKSIWKVTTVY